MGKTDRAVHSSQLEFILRHHLFSAGHDVFTMTVMIQRERRLTIATDLVVLFLLMDVADPQWSPDLGKCITSIDAVVNG